MTWLRAYRLALLLVIGLLPLLVLRANLRRHEPGALDATMLRITAPLQRVVTWAAEGVQYVWFGYLNLVDAEQENRELRSENRRLHDELILMRERVADTARLEGLLAFTATAPAPRLGARVVASTMDARQRVMRIYIDRGAADVRVGMPVIAVGGVVGRVARVLQGYADVMLISDPNSALDVVLPRTQGRGILRGGGAEGRYICQLHWVESEALASGAGAAAGSAAGQAPQVGDEVVTSGFGGVFPAGLSVGRVVAVTRRPYSMFHEVQVAPVVEFTALRVVSVVLAQPLLPAEEAPTRTPFLPKAL